MTLLQEHPQDRQMMPFARSLRDRAGDLLSREIEFIPNPEFEQRQPSDDVVDRTLESARRASSVEMPAHLTRLCEVELLTPEQERALFRRMNYLKFHANAERARIDLEDLDEEQIDLVESLLSEAVAIREHLIKANMRLVMSIAKKFVTPQRSFDEMLSDGIMVLMQAVEKFDYDRGFRFSTYAYRSIARDAYRTVTQAQQEATRFSLTGEDWAFEQETDSASSSITDGIWSRLRDLASTFLKRLDRREQFIIRGRYALGAHRKTRTFQCLADKLGISKERVRQLERRAVEKLQRMASEFEMDELFAASMV